MHVLHQGRSEYVLLTPGATVTYQVMGADISKGETRQLFVAGGVWKKSGIPREDLASGGDREKIGCLITEVVTPGFVWEDHEWMTFEHLREIFKNAPDGKEQIAKYTEFINPDVGK